MDADEELQEVKGQPDQFHDASVDTGDSQEDETPTATLDIPVGPASPEPESSSNSEEDSDQWRSSETLQDQQPHRGPRTPSPSRGPHTPSPTPLEEPQSPPKGPRTPSPHGPRTPPGPRTPSPAGPQTPPSPDGEPMEETPASPVESPAEDSDEEEGYPVGEDTGIGGHFEEPPQGDSLLDKADRESLDDSIQKFDTETPHSPVESADEDDDDSNVEPDEHSISEENRTEQTNHEQLTFNIRPPSPPMPPSESMSPDVKSPVDRETYESVEEGPSQLKDRSPSPPPQQTDSTTEVAGDVVENEPESPETMDDDVIVRDRPPSPTSPPPESQDSVQEDSQPGAISPPDGAAPNGTEDDFHFQPGQGSSRRSPPPQICMNTMDGLEFGQFRPHGLSTPPSSRASLGQSPIAAHAEDSREALLQPSREVPEVVMAAIRERTKSVHIEDSDSHPGSISHESSLLSGADQSAQSSEDVSLYQKVVENQKGNRTESDQQDKISQIAPQEAKSETSADDVKHKEDTIDRPEKQVEKDKGTPIEHTSDTIKDVDSENKDLDHEKEEGKVDETKQEGDETTTTDRTKGITTGDTSEATDIALHPEGRDLDLDDSKEDPPTGGVEDATTDQNADKMDDKADDKPIIPQDGAAVVDVHHIDVHGDELDYEEEVEDHGKDAGKEDKEKEDGEEEEEDGAIDEDLDEGEITVSFLYLLIF